LVKRKKTNESESLSRNPTRGKENFSLRGLIGGKKDESIVSVKKGENLSEKKNSPLKISRSTKRFKITSLPRMYPRGKAGKREKGGERERRAYRVVCTAHGG